MESEMGGRPYGKSMVEAFDVPQIFISGLGQMNLLGDGLIEYVCYRNVKPLNGNMDDPCERQVVLRVVAPMASVAASIKIMTAIMAHSALSKVTEFAGMMTGGAGAH